jgi:hypothetical protein
MRKVQLEGVNVIVAIPDYSETWVENKKKAS